MSNEHLTPVRNSILQVIAKIETIEKSGKIKEYGINCRSARLELKHSLLV